MPEFGPAAIICPYCGEEVHVEAGPTKRVEITHCNDRWIVVDLVSGKAGHTNRYAADGGRIVEPIETCRGCSREAVRGGLCMGHWREHERDLIGDGGLICLAVSPPDDRAPPSRPKPIGPIRRRWHRLVERLHGWVEPDRPSPPGRDGR